MPVVVLLVVVLVMLVPFVVPSGDSCAPATDVVAAETCSSRSPARPTASVTRSTESAS